MEIIYNRQMFKLERRDNDMFDYTKQTEWKYYTN